MAIDTKYAFIVSMDVEPAYEDLFNEVYDTEHVPYLLKVPGVRSVTRLKGEPFALTLGDAVQQMPAPTPIYTAIYELDSPEILKSPEWASAVAAGRWTSAVRPHTKNRSHAVFATRSVQKSG
jgi:hypothetical protein